MIITDQDFLNDLLKIKGLLDEPSYSHIQVIGIEEKENWGYILKFLYDGILMFTPAIRWEGDGCSKTTGIEVYKYSKNYSCYKIYEELDLPNLLVNDLSEEFEYSYEVIFISHWEAKQQRLSQEQFLYPTFIN